MSDDLEYMSATALIEAFRAKRASPVEAARRALERIARYEDSLNAFCFLADEGQIMEAARASEARWVKGAPVGLLDGVPMTVKDTITVQGWPTLRGSKTSDPGALSPEDAPATARIREHGAVILGKTTTPEFGWKGVTDSPLSGVTRNPWDLDRTPGGSSGGAAAALAAGIGYLALGTDAGGSIRIPGGFSGLVGFKASAGRVPSYPPSAFGSLAHHCPLARDVADAALLLTVMAGADGRDWLALPPDGTDYRQSLDNGIAGRRIAYSPTLGYAKVDAEVAAIVDAAVAKVAGTGAADPGRGVAVETVEAPFDDPTQGFMTHFYAGIAHSLRGLSADKGALLDPGLAIAIERGQSVTLTDYLTAVDQRGALGTTMRRFHQDFDFLMTPTLAVPAFAAGQLTPTGDDGDWTAWTPFTYPFNLTGQPAVTVPCGFTAAGLPVGLQIVGAAHADTQVMAAARAVEAALDVNGRRPPL
jgi:aspartyl-tRNA(Asn)/glutamyl-tRNA(Gln) amidotransferase subunit A